MLGEAVMFFFLLLLLLLLLLFLKDDCLIGMGWPMVVFGLTLSSS